MAFPQSTNSDKTEELVAQEISKYLRNPHKPAILAMSRPDPKKNITTLVKAFGENKTLRGLANLVLIMVSVMLATLPYLAAPACMSSHCPLDIQYNINGSDVANVDTCCSIVISHASSLSGCCFAKFKGARMCLNPLLQPCLKLVVSNTCIHCVLCLSISQLTTALWHFISETLYHMHAVCVSGSWMASGLA